MLFLLTGFGTAKLRMKLNGFSEEQLKKGGISTPVIMLTNYISTVLAALALSVFLSVFENGAVVGILIGAIITLFRIGTNRLNNVLYEQQPFKLF